MHDLGAAAQPSLARVRGVRLKPDTTSGPRLPSVPYVVSAFKRTSQTETRESARLPNLTLLDLAGAAQPLRRRNDEVTLLNFWATWCVPCLKEIPELSMIARQLQGQGLQVVGIAIDSGKAPEIRTFAAAHGIDYPVLVGTQQWAAEHFGVFGLPVTIVVDRTGRIRRRLVGAQTGAAIAAAVRPYL